MGYLIYDLPEVWHDLKKLIYDAYVTLSEPKKSPPKIKHIDVGFILLKNHNNEIIGCFVPELFELAKLQGLRAQQEELEWNKNTNKNLLHKQDFYFKLYNSNGVRKTPFALAVIPMPATNDIDKLLIHIQKKIGSEFNYRLKNHQPLPHHVPHTQIHSDYLKRISVINILHGESGNVKINLINSIQKITLAEKILHYIGKIAAIILVVISILSLSFNSPVLFFFSLFATLLTRWGVIQYSIFQLVENLLRESNGFLAKEFLVGEKVSIKKTLKTAILLVALLACTIGAYETAWHAAFKLGLWNITGDTSYWILSKYILATFSGFMAALSTLVSGFMAERFFWGIGIWDKQINFKKEDCLIFKSTQKNGKKNENHTSPRIDNNCILHTYWLRNRNIKKSIINKEKNKHFESTRQLRL